MFYKIKNNLTPEYLRHPLPSRSNYNFRSLKKLAVLPCRSSRFRNSFYPDSIRSWNNISNEYRNARSLFTFKNNILKVIRPKRKDTFNIHDRKGTKWLFQLRVGLSPLKSHKYRHNFMDTQNSMCACALNDETTSHFLLECPTFTYHRNILFRTINPILLLNDLDDIRGNNMVRLLLYGHEKFNREENHEILKATIKYVNESGRFSLL